MARGGGVADGILINSLCFLFFVFFVFVSALGFLEMVVFGYASKFKILHDMQVVYI